MDFNNPLVSVIIPAYNHENYVQDTIKSIIEQTYQNVELIVIDDGSRDLTWQKIQELKIECEKRFVRVHFETKENEGTCKTLNRLFSLVQGEYVYLLASDDVAKPDAIQVLSEFLKTHDDYGLCVGDNEIIDFDGKRAFWDVDRNLVYDKRNAKYLTFVDFLKTTNENVDFNSDMFGSYGSLYFQNYVPNGYLIRTSILKKIGEFSKDAPLEDYWLMLQLSKYSKMKYLDKLLFSYRWHGANTITNKDKIRNYTKMTKHNELNVCEKINISECRQSFKDYLEKGFCYKRIGFKFLFELCRYEKFEERWRVLKIFDLPVKIWIKR